MLKKVIMYLFNLLKNVINKVYYDRIGIYAGQASFFMVMSFFPLLILLLNIISHTSLIPNYFIPNIINKYVPETMQEYIIPVIGDVQKSSSGTMISISALFTIWAASKGSMAVVMGFRLALNTKKTTNWFILRVMSIFYTLVLLAAIVFALTLLVFGNSIFWRLASKYHFLNNLASVYSFSRYFTVLLLLTLFFIVIYKLGSNHSFRFRNMVPGAIFTSVSWAAFSFIFSLYVDNFKSFSYMYGSLTGIMLIMVWVYFCMFILFIGAEINTVIYESVKKEKEN